MEWLLISSALFVLVLLGIGIYQFLWRNMSANFFREVGILLELSMRKTSLLTGPLH